ncbi:MAG: cache domain-containing protein [Nitrospirae bacterium]|nr:cache domain-containing protein [Nitrospirota bacterium]
MKVYILIIGILIFVFSSLITLNIFFQQSLQNEMAEQFNRQQLLLAKSEASNIEGFINDLREESLFLAHVLSRMEFRKSEDYRWATKEVFRGMKDIRTSFKVFDSKGKELYVEGDWPPPQIPDDYLERAKSLQKDHAYVSHDIKGVYAVAPVYKGLSFEGAVAIRVFLEDITRKFLSPIKSGERGYAWMMDKEGDLLYHPTQPQMVGKNLYRADSTCFKCHASFELEKKIIEGVAGQYGRYLAPSGEDKILAFSRASIGGTSWIIAVSAPYSEVTYATQRSMKLYAWLIISIFLTTTIGAMVMVFINRKRIQAEARVRHQEELEKERMMHSEKLASLGRLTAGIAHEIGNPLTSVFSFVQILREMEQDEFKKESLATIHFHISRIADIVRQLSGFSKMPAVEMKEWQVNELIESALSLVQYDKRVKAISIVKELNSEIPKITIDGNQLSQVFVNLILNAIDAMPEGGTLTVMSSIGDGEIRIEFRDTGVGIPMENLAKVFDPFFTTKEKGTGLGLTVSYSIIRRFNGHITAESEAGRGSKFTVSLPLVRE